MALRLPLPRERKTALFPPALSDAVVGGAGKGRREGCIARHIRATTWGPRAADIRSACGFFLWLLHLRLPRRLLLFAPVWGSMQGSSVYGTGACSGPGPPLGLLCSEKWGVAIEMFQVPLGTLTVQQVGKEREFVTGVILSILLTLQAQRGWGFPRSQSQIKAQAEDSDPVSLGLKAVNLQRILRIYYLK